MNTYNVNYKKRFVIGFILSIALILSFWCIDNFVVRHSGMDRNTVAFLASYDITIKRADGDIIKIHKDKDPITKQFILAIIDNFLLIDTGAEKPWLDYSGTPQTLIETADNPLISGYFYRPVVKVVLGNGTTTANANDYTIESPVIELSPTISAPDDTGTEYIITYYVDWVSDRNFTWSELGLKTEIYLYKSSTKTSLLIARDTLTPISIYINDTVSIRYRIYLKYSENGGLTENFFSAIMVYFLGVNRANVELRTYNGYTTDPIAGAPVEIDLGYDAGGTVSDIVADNVTFAVGTVTLNTPVFKTYLVQDIKSSLSQVITVNDNNDNITVSIKYTVTSTSSYNFNALFILLNTEGAANRNGFATKYLMFVAPFDTVSVSSDQYVECTVSITFALTG